MSTSIRGVTFAEQSVTPADDAIVRRAILSDGILSGCSITYSGSTLTMSAGYMIACGRIFQITAARNWAVVDATSGVARLVLTIDLTKTATESAFDQISFNIEYATAENGFVNLTQDDINVSGVRYQVAVAVVSLGVGGITGIISKLEKAEGGGGLNFKVVAGLTQPGSATENTIWVIIERLTGWSFSADEPKVPEEGMVWILTAKSSVAEFNALKRNSIQVYPLSAKQYVDGAWIEVKAKSYQVGQWVDWWDGTIIDGVNQYLEIVGEWVKVLGGTGKVTWDDKGVTLTYSGSSGRHASIYSKEAVDVTGYSVLRTWVTKASGTNLIGVRKEPILTTNINEYAAGYAAYATVSASSEERYVDVDLSSLTGEYHVQVGCGVGTLVIKRMQFLT